MYVYILYATQAYSLRYRFTPNALYTLYTRYLYINISVYFLRLNLSSLTRRTALMHCLYHYKYWFLRWLVQRPNAIKALLYI